MSDPEPKFQESEFLAFLKKVRSGEYEIINNEVILHPEKIGQEMPHLISSSPDLSSYKSEAEEFMRKMEDSRDFEEQVKEELEIQEEKERPNYERYFVNQGDLIEQENNLESQFNSAEKAFLNEAEQKTKINPTEELWKKMYETYDENDPLLAEKLEKIWKESVQNYEDLNDAEAIGDHWQKANALQDLQYLNFSENYKFGENNPFQNHVNPLSLLKEKLMTGDNQQVVMVFEAHLQKNPSDFKAWRSLGMTYQDLDQDQRSVACFLNALKHNPNDKNTYLQLGVSCTNMFDEIHAMSFLEKWLQTNPAYSSILQNAGLASSIIPEERLSLDNWEIAEVETITQQMIAKFSQVQSLAGNTDPELILSLAVMNIAAQNFEQALFYFKQVTELDPTNYSYWNKLGATYAHLKSPQESQNCYHRALDMKPNYVRGWTNLAIHYNAQVI